MERSTYLCSLAEINGMIGTLNNEEIEEVLLNQVMGRLAFHADDNTYIVPISYAYDGQYIYIHTGEGMKTEMMRKNPKVCFETDHLLNMANWKSVIVWGTCEEVNTKTDRHSALSLLLNRILPIISSETTHLSPQWPFPPDNLDEIKGVICKITVNKKTGRFEKNQEYTARPF
jgi:nitroimidazol reductase NimA-like FMN-containing flavoprotein (pyridoxamine 5'-phosphate oxidase superfamily)